jgi:hypothetical protein
VLVVLGWVLVVGALVWAWVVFLTKQAEIGLWIAIVVAGIGFVLQRIGSRH